MELTSLVAGLFIGIIIAYIIFYLRHQTKTVSKTAFQELSAKHNETVTNLRLFEDKARALQATNNTLSDKVHFKGTEAIRLQKEATSLETHLINRNEKVEELSQRLAAELETNKMQQHEVNKLKESIAILTTNNQALTEKLETQKTEIEALQKTAHLQFEKIANKLFEEKSAKFTETNKVNIETILNPLKEEINHFKTKVEDTYNKESQQRFSLEQKVKDLIEQTNKVSAEANNLAMALKGNPQKRGSWGEMILERILESSGLTKDREYFIQQSIKDDEGNNLRPDVSVNLPDERVIIIDSKVSLIAYDKFCASEHSNEQKAALAQHLNAMKQHIEQLSAKKYNNLETSLDFTMMFIPIEPAYLLAIQSDPDLWAYAYSKRILLVSPTNLIACLKLISDLWKREWQSKNAMEIVRKGEALYEKFVGFTKTFEEIGNSIKSSQEKYDKALGQLKDGRGNLINQAIQLKNLGLKSDKKIPKNLLPLDMDDAEMENANDREALTSIPNQGD
ncbi:MAG: DNA recombination protein RmuC [Niabella sp.]